MTETAKAALKKIRALQALGEREHIYTTKSQREILKKLGPEDLTLVALALQDEEIYTDGFSRPVVQR
jgi:hypothetical protein